MYIVRRRYSVWRGHEIVVKNPQAGAIRGKTVVAGIDAGFWKRVADSDRGKLLPAEVSRWVDMGMADVISGFYQVAIFDPTMSASLHAGLHSLSSRF